MVIAKTMKMPPINGVCGFWIAASSILGDIWTQCARKNGRKGGIANSTNKNAVRKAPPARNVV
jgi:hypothetical protein